jgi:hypothetical protein
MMEAQKDEKLKLKRQQLNHLLGFTCVRLKERVGTIYVTDGLVKRLNMLSLFMANSVSFEYDVLSW